MQRLRLGRLDHGVLVVEVEVIEPVSVLGEPTIRRVNRLRILISEGLEMFDAIFDKLDVLAVNDKRLVEHPDHQLIGSLALRE